MWEKELEEMKIAALEAEKVILEIYETSFDVETKDDDSPVTIADLTADKIIKERLSKAFPDYGFLTEESVDTKERLSKDHVFIVDPVDGTHQFVQKAGGFSTNIALAYKGEVVAAVINIPVQHKLYYAVLGQGSFCEEDGKVRRLHVSNRARNNLRLLVSLSFYSEKEKSFTERHKDLWEEVIPLGASLKFCEIAEGKAELAVRYSSGTKEWDTAAGDLIITEAGGVFLDPKGDRFRYNREDVYNREGYIAANSKENIIFEK
ncbi:MAG: 3'(2'),5'-bisphosphate nucleotidase CysQ [Bacilli bacterium]|nr:3'(2'),5'-bisphosphate nucleotidase CysQ [Bacilli bacterium]